LLERREGGMGSHSAGQTVSRKAQRRIWGSQKVKKRPVNEDSQAKKKNSDKNKKEGGGKTTEWT